MSGIAFVASEVFCLFLMYRLEDAENRQVSSVPRTPPPPDFKEGTAVPHVCISLSV